MTATYPCDTCTYCDEYGNCLDPYLSGRYEDCPNLTAFRFQYEQQAEAAYMQSLLE